MERETRICQNCQEHFTIESEDFSFYEKIKVPPPTFCPQCRAIRRMTWRNERSLFKRNCAKTGNPIITMFHPETQVTVYDRDVWWSDAWDPTLYGTAYDFSRPFFEQYKELLSKVPLANLGNTHVVNSPYGNHNADCKDCYLLYASYNNERVSYSQGAVELKDCLDVYTMEKSEQCYSSMISSGLYQVHFSNNVDESLNSWFLQHSINCQDCIGCINLRNKTNCIFNEQYSKEEYAKKKAELDFGSYTILSEFEKKYYDFALKFPRKYMNVIRSHDVTGDNIGYSKNVKSSFDIYHEVEDSKYMAHCFDLKDSYDVYGAGASASLLYEGIDSALQASRQLFAVLTHSCLDTMYTYMCYNSKNLFGCIGIRKGEYCILNKKYSKEEYEALVPKIIDQMNEMPFVDSHGRTYRYGEFFPSEFSPFTYNETIAQEYFPKSKEQMAQEGYQYRQSPEREYQPTLHSSQLPDHIQDVADTIVDEIIACPNEGSELTQCTVAYRITKEELSFLRRHRIAVPRYCPNCRHYSRLALRNPLKLWHRQCMCRKEDHDHETPECPNEFETAYSPNRPETIYCEKCYQHEVV